MRRLSPLALIAALALAACGGDDAQTPAEYRAEAKKICTDADNGVERVKQPTRATPDAIVSYFQALLKPSEQATKRFEALSPPEELEKAHADVLKANREGITEVRRVVSELEGGGDPRRVLTAAEGRIRSLSGRADAAAKRLGVPECGEDER